MNSAAAIAETEDCHLLDASVRELMVQFIIKDRSLVSNWLWRQEPDRKAPASTKPGIKIILPTLFVGLKALITELKHGDAFRLADASGVDNPERRAVRFTFARPPIQVGSSDHAEYLKVHAWPSLDRLCREAMWQVCAFRNPRTEGAGISINCNARLPYSTEKKAHRFLVIADNRLVLE